MADKVDIVLEYISLYRVCWIAGRLRFGKTALATILAKRMLEAGLADGVITNYPTILPAHIRKDDGLLHNRVLVYDEAWQDHDSRTSMSNDQLLGAWMGKLGAYLICPSVHPIDKRLRSVEIRPVSRSVFRPTLTTWRYKIADDDKQPTTGEFAIDISEAYGLYSTSYIPTGNCGIIDRFMISFYVETGNMYDKRRDAANTDRAIETASYIDAGLGE